MNNLSLLDYKYYYQEAAAAHEDLQTRLEEMPMWLINEKIGLTNEEPILELLYQEGIQDIDQTTGRPLTMLEWLEYGCYSVHDSDNQALVDNYLNYLDNYQDDLIEIKKGINWDTMRSPFAVHHEELLGRQVYAYEIIRGIRDYIAIGFEFGSSELYGIEWNTPEPYIEIGTNKLYLHDFIKIRDGWL